MTRGAPPHPGSQRGRCRDLSGSPRPVRALRLGAAARCGRRARRARLRILDGVGLLVLIQPQTLAKRWLAASPTARRAFQLSVVTRRPTPKSRALQMTAGIADDRFGTQRPLVLEVLLDPAGLVVAADLRIDPFGDDLGAPATRGLSGDAPVEDQRHRLGSAHVEVIAESCSKNERPAAGRSNTRVSETSNLRNAGS